MRTTPGRCTAHARDHRPRQALRERRRARRRHVHGPARPHRRLPRTERRRQDDDDALHLRAGPVRSRRGALGRPAGRPRHPAALRVHARAARPVSADACRRAAQLLRPAARPVGQGGRCRGPAVARTARPRRSREVEARGAVAREPAADPARHGPRPRPGAARPRRAVLGTRPARHGDHDRGRPRACGGRRRGALLEPPAGPRRGRLRGRRDHRPRPDRRFGPDRRAQGCLGPAASRHRGGRHGWRVDRQPSGRPGPRAQRRPDEAARRRPGPARRAPGRRSHRRRAAPVQLPAATPVGAVHGGRGGRRRRRGRARRARRALGAVETAR